MSSECPRVKIEQVCTGNVIDGRVERRPKVVLQTMTSFGYTPILLTAEQALAISRELSLAAHEVQLIDSGYDVVNGYTKQEPTNAT